ncbi:MAG TPA: peptide-methionine (S)-S-oxide reductase MsrA, partial [Chitinophagaceae bacterium]
MNGVLSIVVTTIAALASCGEPSYDPPVKKVNLTDNNKTTMSTTFTGKTDTATLANGCFWCTEAIFEELDGVISAISGYTGGKVENPTYKQVCSGETGHAECLQIIYDPQKISFDGLLEVFWETHDPTT